MHYIIQSIMLVSSLIISPVNKPDALSDLKEQIQKELANQKGVFAVAFKDLSTGKEILINEKENFHAASTMKTPVLIEAYKQAASGKFAITDSVLIKNEFKSIVDGSTFSLDPDSDSDQEIYTKAGQKLPLSDLLYRMIIKSSNLATNLIIELVGAQNVTQTMRSMGANDIQVRRGVEDSKAYQKGLNNTTTAFDLMLMFAEIGAGKTVSADASQAMIGILLDQQFNDIIPAKLPKTVKVAHKTGFITGVQHDSGIVILPDGRKYVLVLLSKNIRDQQSAVGAMARVSELIYQYVSS
ncbi:MAG TPA: serine hydrolase [Sphingobacteriaceae bacterium]